MNTAIIVAAGSGLRFGGLKPKQFIDILGKPLIVHTLERFENCPSVDAIVLVLSDHGKAEFVERDLGTGISKLIKTVEGGATRAASVQNGLLAVPNTTKIVAVHDGARPLVSSRDITAVFEAADRTGAACLVAEVTDTIKEIEGDNIVHTVGRDILRKALTPQAFRLDILKEAFEKADDLDQATDDCYLVEKIGHRIEGVPGDPRNIKITRPEDIHFAELCIASE
jgi:2-C-methyl-D-erythritol 4-phosphate cytidylyltransferase